MSPASLSARYAPPALLELARRAAAWRDGLRYERGGRLPWAPGYDAHRWRVVESALDDPAMLARFRRGEALPRGYGVRVGERAIELPWVYANLDDGRGRLLDAGSALNHGRILARERLARKTVHVVTLAPEEECHWRRGVSYLYHDLRRLPLVDDLYDVVACISTLEHVGCDNSGYTGAAASREDQPGDFALVMQELARVLRPGGTLLLTVPFGRYRHHGTFQQFDRALLTSAEAAFGKAASVTETFYRYAPEGWQAASAEACADAEYADWGMLPHAARRRAKPPADGAAAARAVACVRIEKP